MDPVSLLYCRNTSFGLGPSMKNVSMMPLSDIKWESIWGGAVDLDTKFTIEETTFWSAGPKISTQVSAAFNQKTPAVWVSLKQRVIFTGKLFSEGFCIYCVKVTANFCSTEILLSDIRIRTCDAHKFTRINASRYHPYSDVCTHTNNHRTCPSQLLFSD